VLIPTFDVLAAITPNTYNASGSASASITARTSSMATPITVAATHATDRPSHNGEPGITHAKAAECLRRRSQALYLTSDW